MFIVEPNLLSVKKIVINDEQLDGLTVVFASDFHIKPYEKYRLKKIVKAINKLSPDLILLGGDYYNGHNKGFTMSASNIATELKKLNPKLGTIAIMGNHDGWQGKYKIIKEFEKNKIIVLENSYVKLGNITIAGVEDLQTGNPSLIKALNSIESPIILLTHSPDVFPQVPKKVNLTLAGHTHNGQFVFPNGKTLIIPSAYGTRYAYGLKEEDGKKIFISKGLGTSIIPLRFNCIPEIVLVKFVK